MSVLPFDLPGIEPDPQPAAPAPAARPAPVLVYESDRAAVWHGDARDVLRNMEKESVALVATDPPYGKAWQSRRRKEKFAQLANDTAADRDVIREVIEQSVRVVAQQRHLYVFGPSDPLDGLKVSDVVTLYWDKGTIGSGDMTAPWGPQVEPINFTVSKFRHAGKAGLPTLPTRLRKGNLLSYTRPTGTAVRHPDEKPVPLMRELLESSSRQGETVLDPFGGSGSTGVAAILTGRKVILVEVDEEWATMCVDRVQKAERLVEQMSGI